MGSEYRAPTKKNFTTRRQNRRSFLPTFRLKISKGHPRDLVSRVDFRRVFMFLIVSDLLGRFQPSKATTQKAPGTLGVEESSSP